VYHSIQNRLILQQKVKGAQREEVYQQITSDL
jgi:hypothetical protein